MNEAAPQTEPSMEEILASIRRIISEDDEPNSAPEETGEAAPAADAPAAVEELPPVEAPAEAPAAAAEPEPLPEIAPIPEAPPVAAAPPPPPPAAEPPPMELPELPELPPPEMPPMAAMSAPPPPAPVPAPVPVPAPASDSDLVLTLTDEVRPDGTVVNIETGLPVNGAPPAPRPVELELRDPPPARAPILSEVAKSPANNGDSPLVSNVTEQVAAESLAAVRPADQTYMPPAMPAVAGIGAQTIDQLVRDAVRPLIKEWLDANLPAMVENLVAKEISRIGRIADK